MKYTDADGIERSLDLATLNGSLVLIDDTMPTTTAYETTAGTAVVSGKTYYTLSGSKYTAVAEPKTADIATYYEAYTTYTSYVLGSGAIEMTDCGAKVPSEMVRDALCEYGVAIKKAECALIDVMYQIDYKARHANDTEGGNIKSMSSGGRSISFGSNETLIDKVLGDKTAQNRLCRGVVSEYLSGTGLLYAGY